MRRHLLLPLLLALAAPNTETLIDATKSQPFTGSFTLLPLAMAWPAPLTHLFGPPARAANIYRPFYYSYDQ
jgi:hypothetical protein